MFSRLGYAWGDWRLEKTAKALCFFSRVAAISMEAGCLFCDLRLIWRRLPLNETAIGFLIAISSFPFSEAEVFCSITGDGLRIPNADCENMF